MKLKGFNKFINESFAPIDVELYEAGQLKAEDLEWIPIAGREFPTEKDAILKSINSLKWESVTGSKPAGYGLTIKETIQEFKIPKVDQIAYGGTPFGTKAEPGAAYSVFGVIGHYINGTRKLFFVDGGSVVIPVASVLVGEAVTESDLDEAATTPARKHPLYKKLVKFIAADMWDELLDMARTAREYHTEYDLDMTYDEHKTNPNAPQPLDYKSFNDIKSWSAAAREYIIDMLDKMGEQAANSWFDDFAHWLK